MRRRKMRLLDSQLIHHFWLPTLFCLLGLSGCELLFNTRNVTDDVSYWGGFRPKQIYSTSIDTFLVDSQEHSPKWMPELVNPGNSSYPQLPHTIPEFRADPESYSPTHHGIGAVGVVAHNTRIEITRLMWWESTTNRSKHVATFGTILDGPYAGTEVRLDELSTSPASAAALTSRLANPEYLTLVQ